MRRPLFPTLAPLVLLAVAVASGLSGVAAEPSLEEGFRSPPPAARPHTYWLWLNGYVHQPTANAELQAMKDLGLSGVLLFEMGARGDKATMPPPGPAFLSTEWVKQLRESTQQAKALGLQVDLSVISSWDLGGPWIEPKHASMALYSTETSFAGGKAVDVTLPFPLPEKAAPQGPDGKPAFWTDVAVLAVRAPKRLAGHEFVIQLDPEGVHDLREVVLDNGRPNAPAELAATMTPVRDFSLAISTTGARSADFTEVLRGQLPATAGPVHFPLPAGTQARHVRLTLLSGHDATCPRWTLAEFEAIDVQGVNVAGSRVVHPLRNGARLLRAPASLSSREWSAGKVNDGLRSGGGGIFASAGLPPFDLASAQNVIDVSTHVGRDDHLRWTAPAGDWTILRYVCMNTGERLKIPTPSSDGLTTDHLNPAATRVHMDHVIAQLRAGLGDLRESGLGQLYLASYEVVGKVWSPVFAEEFKRRRGYELTRFLPAIFGARIDDEQTTERFLFDYEKSLGEVIVDAYYNTARDIAHAAGLTIKSEAGGPGPPIHSPPVDALLANGAVDGIQGEFWPFWDGIDSIWVVKETAAAGHIYGKRVVHMESFTSFHHWAEGPQDLKPSADRVLTEGGNHFVWHTWTHQPPEAGYPGWVYNAGTHLNRSVTWWPKAKPFIDYLARSSFLLQRGNFSADVLYYYGDGGANFVNSRKNPPSLGPGYDYDVTNADVLLHRFSVKDGRLTLPEGTRYALLVLPERDDIHPAVLAKIESLVRDGATLLGRRPTRATGLEGFPASDRRVREIADRLWGDLDGKIRTSRACGRGRVFTGVPERQVLEQLHLAPDFIANAALDFTHRSDAAGEIYFVRNKTADAVNTTATFRANAGTPEFWDAVTGKISPVPVLRRTPAGVEIPLALAPHGSVFVVFPPSTSGSAEGFASVSEGASLIADQGVPRLLAERNGTYEATRANGGRTTVTVAGLPEPLSLDADWTVEFQSPVGAPAKLTLPRVDAWTKQDPPALKYFSGTGTYRKTFTLPAGWKKSGQRVDLDLGRLWTIGEAWLNGQSLGVLWTPPFRVACTDLLRDGENELTVEVINTWHNRLVGDASLPAASRVTHTNIPTSRGKPWKDLAPIESGLLGPVRLIAIGIKDLPREGR